MAEGGESCSARCAEQPFDVAFHPTNKAIFVTGLITGAVRTPPAPPSFREYKQTTKKITPPPPTTRNLSPHASPPSETKRHTTPTRATFLVSPFSRVGCVQVEVWEHDTAAESTRRLKTIQCHEGKGSGLGTLLLTSRTLLLCVKTPVADPPYDTPCDASSGPRDQSDTREWQP
jgi:hypothetical protein